MQRAPFLACLALLAGLGLWGHLEWRGVRDRHHEQMRRFAAGIAQTLTVLRRGLADGRPLPVAAFEPVLARLVDQTPHLRFAAIVRDGRSLVEIGRPIPALELTGAVGETIAGDFYIFWFALEPPPGVAGLPPGPQGRGLPGPPAARRPAGDGRRAPPGTDFLARQSHRNGGPPADPRPLPPGVAVLVTAIDRTFPEELRHTEGRELTVKLVIGALGIFALMAAWLQSGRRRSLGHRLDAERTERARWQELSLAASGLTHETKNPLGIIRGLAQRIADDPAVPESGRVRADQIVDQADRAVARLGDFLSYARAREPEPAAVDARAVLEKAVAVLTPELEEAGVPIALEVDDLRVWADGEMLLQIVLNLLLNSLEASAPGEAMTIRLNLRGKRARLSLEDRGCGIEPSMVDEVFKPYVSGRPGGHGLGLALVRRFAEQHGWTVGLTSEPGEGTRIDIDGLRVVDGRQDTSPLGLPGRTKT